MQTNELCRHCVWVGCCSTDKHCQTHNPNNSQFRIHRKAWQQLQRNFSSSGKLPCSENRIITMCMEVTFCGSARAEICATKRHFQGIQFLITSCTPDSPSQAPSEILGAFPRVCRDFQRLREPGSAEQNKEGAEVGYPWKDWKAGDLRDKFNISKDSRATGRNKQSLFIIQVLCRGNSIGGAFGGIFLMDY